MKGKSVHEVTCNFFSSWNGSKYYGSSATVGFISCKQKSGDFSFYISFAEDIQWTCLQHNIQLLKGELYIVLAVYEFWIKMVLFPRKSESAVTTQLL